MKKGTIVIVVPDDSDFRLDNFADNWPEEFKEHLDGWIHILRLPEGGSLHLGEKSIEVLGGIHKQIHDMLGD